MHISTYAVSLFWTILCLTLCYPDYSLQSQFSVRQMDFLHVVCLLNVLKPSLPLVNFHFPFRSSFKLHSLDRLPWFPELVLFSLPAEHCLPLSLFICSHTYLLKFHMWIQSYLIYTCFATWMVNSQKAYTVHLFIWSSFPSFFILST